MMRQDTIQDIIQDIIQGTIEDTVEDAVEEEQENDSYIPPTVAELFEHYKAKGILGPGKMVYVMQDELKYLLEEEGWEDTNITSIIISANILRKRAILPSTAIGTERTFKASFSSDFESCVHLSRSWTDYQTIIGKERREADFPTEWTLVMFIGIEEYNDAIVGSPSSKAKWARWLVGEKIFVGWIHPDAMKEFVIER